MTNVQVGLKIVFLEDYEYEAGRDLEGTEEGESIEVILACEVAINLMSKSSGEKSCQSTTDKMTEHRRELINIHNTKFEDNYLELNEDLWA